MMAMITHMNERNGRNNRPGGFTLIELMIVVAVIAILASIAYPSYADSVRKGRRGQAKADLMELSQLAERHRTVNNGYTTFSLPFSQSPREGGTAHYALTVDEATATTFVLEAKAQGPQAKDKCGNLSINQAGVKTVSGGTVATCW